MPLKFLRSRQGVSSSFILFSVVLPGSNSVVAAEVENTVLPMEEVTVSARRRDESLQDVPIAVTAYQGDALARQGVADIVQLAESAPNTTLKVSRGTNTTITAFIRGIGQQDPLAGYESGVGIYIDDVYLNRPQAAVLDIYDVERVEILRGPQGTLYGKNTIGGAIKYVTRALADEPRLRLTGSVGDYNQRDFVLTGSAPVTDGLRVGGSLATFMRDGFGENLYTGAEHYDKDIRAGRLTVEWEPAAEWFLRFTADASDDQSNPKSGHRLIDATLTDNPILDDVFDTRAGVTQTNSISRNRVKQHGAALNAQWSVTEGLVFKSITGYRKDDTETPIDFDSLPDATFDVPAVYENRQFSQELQLQFEQGNWQGVAGLYYLDANAFNAFDVAVSNLGLTIFTLGDVDSKTWAAYADVEVELSEQFSLSIGGRFTDDQRRSTVIRDTYSGVFSPYFGNPAATSITPITTDNNGVQVAPVFNGQRSDSDFTPRISLQWQPAEALLGYVSYSTGFKGGSFDPRGDYAKPEIRDGFEPETVNAYEVGLKASLWNGRLVLNSALFYSDYNDVQIPGSEAIDTDNDGLNDSFVGTVSNAGKAKISGIELEVSGRITERLSLQSAVGYTNAEYKEFVVSGVDVAADRFFQNTPELTAFTGLAYTQMLNNPHYAGTLDYGVQLAYRSEVHQFEVANPLLDQGGYSLVNANVVWTSNNGQWQVGLHGKNLTDKRYKVAGYSFAGLGDGGQTQSAFYGNPRTVTATVRYQFF